MPPTRPLLLVAGVLATAWLLPIGCADFDDPRADLPDGPRNVILLVVDTLRADRLGCYGYVRNTTPNLDQMAEAGTIYLDHRPQGVITISSMISMMSGLYVTGPEEVLPDYQPTMAEVIQRAGLATVGFAGNANLTDHRGFDRGFDSFERVEGGRGHVIIDKFENWYGENKADAEDAGGFFAWLHFMDPHAPYEAEPDLMRKFDTVRPDQAALVKRWNELYPEVKKFGQEAPTLQQFLHYMIKVNNQYDAEVASSDRAIGTLRTFLAEQGLDDNTLLIIASDHGEQLFEAPRYAEDVRRMTHLGRGQIANCYFDYGHGTSFREESWRTPLIIDGPGFAEGARITGLTANLDLFPTILDYFDVNHPKHLAGYSLFEGVPAGRDHVFGYTKEVFAVKDVQGRKFIDRTGRMPIYRPAERDLEADGEPIEIFRIADGEDTNLAPETPEGVKTFRRLLSAFRKDHNREWDTTLTPEDLQALKELGYLDD